MGGVPGGFPPHATHNDYRPAPRGPPFQETD